jgi:hypothetical protein
MKHPGFKKVAASISAKEHVSPVIASAILASASRKNAATSKNKNLKKVK